MASASRPAQVHFCGQQDRPQAAQWNVRCISLPAVAHGHTQAVAHPGSLTGGSLTDRSHPHQGTRIFVRQQRPVGAALQFHTARAESVARTPYSARRFPSSSPYLTALPCFFQTYLSLLPPIGGAPLHTSSFGRHRVCAARVGANPVYLCCKTPVQSKPIPAMPLLIDGLSAPLQHSAAVCCRRTPLFINAELSFLYHDSSFVG